MFWAALHRFTGPRPLGFIVDSFGDGAQTPSLPDADDDDDDLPRPQRSHRQALRHPDYVDSSRIKITSSSPTQPSSASTSDHTGYISREEHNRRSISEDATVELASACDMR